MNKKIWLILSLLCFFLLTGDFFYSHAEQAMKFRAEYWLKKNNTPMAMKYYEYAFELGLKNPASSDAYVNILLKDDIDSFKQEKLLKFLTYKTNDGAMVRAEDYLSDLKSEIRYKYYDNYIKNAPYNHKLLRWSTLPITYGFANDKNIPNYYEKEIENAFKTWEIETARRICFERTENTANVNILIKFNQNQPTSAENDGEKYVVAYTNPNLDGDMLTRMTMDFFVTDSEQQYFSPNQIYNTALHEICHAIGVMGHSDHSKDIMYMTLDPQITTNDLRAKLSKRDVNTVALLYKTKPDLTDKKNFPADYAQEIVIGGEKEITSAKIQEAKSYIRKAPNIPAGYIDLAEGLVAVKEYEKALKSLNKALKLSDNKEINGMIYYNFAIIYNLIKDYDNAKSYLDKSIAINETEQHHQLLAEIYTDSGNIPKAIKEYEYLITNNPSDIEYVIALANIYVREKKYMSARKVLKRFIENNPKEKENIRLAPYGIIKLGL